MVNGAPVLNVIGGRIVGSCSGASFEKRNPANGQVLYQVARSNADDVAAAVKAAVAVHPSWAALGGIRRGMVLHAVCRRLQDCREEIARVVHDETGKGLGNARGETDGAIQLGLFFAGEGQRLYGRTTTSGTAGRSAMTTREPLGVAGLVVAANTPIANVAWKVFPALICGNAAVLKAAEDAPGTASLFARIASEAGLPDGVLNVVNGFGEEAGAPLVEHADVAVVSFTGSTAVGRRIAVACGERLKRVSLELGGKNPLVVCDDADLELAARWVLLSAFSNAGQRCASGSRVIVFDAVYERFRDMLIDRAAKLKVGTEDTDDLGPVINERQLLRLLDTIGRAMASGAVVLTGGRRLEGAAHERGYYLAPTIVEAVGKDDEMSTCELFGPITNLYRVTDFEAALALANDSPYGLTACIHTRSVHRALEFTRRVQAGVAIVNAGTYGSEPHMPFGGVKQSGNGSREPGTEAIDVYSNLKDVYMQVDPAAL